MESKDEYIIPKNVNTRFEFFAGFGWIELFVTALGILVGGLVFLVMGMFNHSPFRIVVIALGGAAGFMISYADPRTGKNVISFFKDYKKFTSTPRRYKYKFGEGRDTFDQ